MQVVEIFLHDYVTATGERGIFLADKRGLDHRFAAGILSAVDEPQGVSVIEVTKAAHLVDRRDRVAKTPHNLRRHFEAEIHPLGADTEQQVPGSRDRMARPSSTLPEWVSEQPVPRL
jgi:hypothetical protein